MLVEVRTYKTKPGKRDAWVRLFEDELLPFMNGLGMKVPGSFNSTEDPDTFVWLRSFEDAASREALIKAFRGAPAWTGGLQDKVRELVESMEVQVVESTAKSLL